MVTEPRFFKNYRCQREQHLIVKDLQYCTKAINSFAEMIVDGKQGKKTITVKFLKLSE